MTLLKYSEFLNESKKDYIEKYCKETSEVPQTPMKFQDIYSLLKKFGNKYKQTIESIKKGEAAIVGIRKKIQTRKSNPEKYIDSIYFIPKNSINSLVLKTTITPFQATTVPSVAWYDTEVAILDDAEYRFKIGTHTFKSLKKTIPALVPDTEGLGPKEINVNRFSKKDDTVNTFDPPKKDIGTSTNFHYGERPKALKVGNTIPCVGPYSAGCQVIASEKKWNDFWGMVKTSAQEKFWYSIIEEDKI